MISYWTRMLSRNTISGRRRQPQCLAQPGLNPSGAPGSKVRIPIQKECSWTVFAQNYFVRGIDKECFCTSTRGRCLPPWWPLQCSIVYVELSWTIKIIYVLTLWNWLPYLHFESQTSLQTLVLHFQFSVSYFCLDVLRTHRTLWPQLSFFCVDLRQLILFHRTWTAKGSPAETQLHSGGQARPSFSTVPQSTIMASRGPGHHAHLVLGHFQVGSLPLVHVHQHSWMSKSIFFPEVLVTQLCLILHDPLDYRPPGSSVHGILQARTLEWVAMPFSRGSSQLRDGICVSCVAGRFFTIWATREAHFFLEIHHKCHCHKTSGLLSLCTPTTLSLFSSWIFKAPYSIHHGI